MNRLRLWIRNIFGFSRAETNGFLILLPLMILVLFSQPVYRFLSPPPVTRSSVEQARLDSLIAHWDFNPPSENTTDGGPLFPFNPNTATEEELKSLGFPSTLSRRVINYRTKGGIFNDPDDLMKIYGMDSSLFTALIPYINIPKQLKSTKNGGNIRSIKKTPKDPVLIDLNLADTAQFITVYGIGPVLAKRIVSYREKLGGFLDIGQLKNVYGLDSTVVKTVATRFFVDPDFVPNQLDINKSTERQLADHPYIKYKLAKTIVAYRFQHGSFKEIDDLLKIDLINEQVFENIRPYLKVEQ